MGGLNPAEIVDLLNGRNHYLVFLSCAPRQKREIIDEFETPRSTVDRDVRRLEDAGLIERTRDGYRTTAFGRLACDGLSTLYRQFDGICSASDMISELSAVETPCLSVFDDPVTLCFNPRDIDRPVTHVRELIEGASAVKGLLPFVSTAIADTILNRLAADDVSAELIFADDVFEILFESYTETTRRMIESSSVELFERPTLPFGLVIAEGECDRVAVFPDPHRGANGIVVNDNERSVAWGNRIYRTYRSDSQRLPTSRV